LGLPAWPIFRENGNASRRYGRICSRQPGLSSELKERPEAGTPARLADCFLSRSAGFRARKRTAGAYHVELGGHILVIALVAALLGFGGIAGASIEIAKIVFFVALILFLISAVVGLARRSGGP
jgi:uncharacterized membrane protein YtjA (UPF0391 family)